MEKQSTQSRLNRQLRVFQVMETSAALIIFESADTAVNGDANEREDRSEVAVTPCIQIVLLLSHDPTPRNVQTQNQRS